MMGRSWARVLLHGGVAVVVVALSKFHASRIADPPYDFTESFRFSAAVAFVALLFLAAYGAGLPDRRATRLGALLAAGTATGTAALGVSVIQLVGGTAVLPRFVVLGAVLILTPWFVLCARVAADLSKRARATDRVLVVGDLADVGSLLIDLDELGERPATLVEIMQPAAATGTHRRRPLVDLARTSGATVVVLDSAASTDPSIVRQAAQLHESGTRVRTLLGFYEEWLGKLPVAELERVSMLFDIAELHRGTYAPMKRIVDVAIGLVMLVALVVTVPVVVVANWVGNRGPLWFRQPRVGKGGVVFDIWKFRTMAPSTQASPQPTSGLWTGAGDARVTRFGGVLRRTHLDELPQAINILRGELSVVGPRPEQPGYVDELTTKLPFYRLRHLVQPGLTGWAQVKYGYASTNADALEKLQYEMYYLRHQSLRFDAQIIIRTFRSMLGGPGAGR